jgi:hypothetical protein
MTNGREPVDMQEWNDQVDAAKARAKAGEMSRDDFNKKMKDLGMNPTETEEEWNNALG